MTLIDSLNVMCDKILNNPKATIRHINAFVTLIMELGGYFGKFYIKNGVDNKFHIVEDLDFKRKVK